MRATILAAVIASLAAGTAVAQTADTQPPPAASAPRVCLWTYQIDHTTVVSPQMLQFHMKNGKIWNATLKNNCRSLGLFGFSYITPDGQICSNQQAIYVLRTGATCLLGDIAPAAAAAPEAH